MKASTSALAHTEHPVQWAVETIFLGVKHVALCQFLQHFSSVFCNCDVMYSWHFIGMHCLTSCAVESARQCTSNQQIKHWCENLNPTLFKTYIPEMSSMNESDQLNIQRDAAYLDQLPWTLPSLAQHSALSWGLVLGAVVQEIDLQVMTKY